MVGIEQIQEFLFESEQQGGYATGGQRIIIPDLPGYKTIRFVAGDFCSIDSWCVNPQSHWSAGTKTILYKNVPVWWTAYGGFYEESVIPFLKRALRAAVDARKFFGGRGPLEFREDTLTYCNRPSRNEFIDFAGNEEIFETESGDLRGHHDYWGMILF